ncbi:hypothetical protein SAMN04488063_3509 [Halopelagius inordinatus]|uniref:NPCBM-associated, NEW3 domain of alpha-galactosidase n=1 Tax=Halopelagius inordinatus TaxID=553467 RepID=A0A1I2WGD1_9EURY|nr:hypothetical protein [Halopelagius inordinatus]SFG99386.1 hypothetical protein SAMN04488063_3509 [Halopelagius inordinatus]
MKKELLIAALVVLSALPVVAAQTQSNSLDAPAVDTDAAAQTTAVASESAAGSASSDDAEWNYTNLYVDSENGYLDLKPGESEEFSVVVENEENDSVTVDPHLYVPPTSQDELDDSWVEIDGDTDIAAGEEAEFTVTVSVPEDAEIGRYSGMIAFTDERITYPGRPPRPVHAAQVGVEVWKEPTVRIRSETYVRGQVEAGDSITNEIVVENTGDSAVPLSPELADERSHCRGSGCPLALDPSWVDIDAPSELSPGETATVSITLSPPADAERGRYDTQVDLGLKDPARDERNTHWQEVDLNYVVWRQPSEPFETSVEVSERADDLTLTLSPRSAHYSTGADDGDAAAFDVQFVSPSGETVDAERVRVSDNGHVDLGRSQPRATNDGEYAVRDGGTEFVYRVDDPEAGTWDVKITPHNAIGFSYELVREESSDDETSESTDGTAAESSSE